VLKTPNAVFRHESDSDVIVCDGNYEAERGHAFKCSTRKDRDSVGYDNQQLWSVNTLIDDG